MIISARVRQALVLLSAPFLGALGAQAQDSSGVIGRVFDERTNEVIVEVLLFVDGDRREITLSRQGRFVLGGMAPGLHRLEVRAIGYRPYTLDVELLPRQIAERQFPMVFTGERLPDIDVESRNAKLLPRFTDFERRRQNKMGHFITRDEIRSRGYMRLGDAMKGVRGVRVDCTEMDCIVHMARAPTNCFPTYYVDGRLTRSFASSTPVSDIHGIEVYRSAAEMPGEFSGDSAMCGVIVVWTRAAP
jgi:hypothetical protein